HSELHAVRDTLDKKGYKIESAELVMNPNTTVTLDESQASTFLKTYDALEESDDVQKVWANFDIPDEVMSRLSAA
ncbi:MAG: YebC/PmpR family DNA-binding transcriptional regulator, partial [Candidatus Zixiibacteriota bacterium]